MREILFRGKRKDDGLWEIGDLIQHDDGTKEIKRAGFINTFEVIPETIGQYTGLKDKNGKRIFEGDIVRLIESCPSCHDTEIVKFKDGGFAPFSIAGWECTPKWEECEVIGTIHDNPELLEEEK